MDCFASSDDLINPCQFFVEPGIEVVEALIILLLDMVQGYYVLEELSPSHLLGNELVLQVSPRPD